jgi:hypothetical protein
LDIRIHADSDRVHAGFPAEDRRGVDACALEGDPAEIAGQQRTAQVGRLKVRTADIRVVDQYAAHIGDAQVGAGQIGKVDAGTAQVGQSQVGSGEIGFVDEHVAQVGPGEVDIVQVATHCRAAQAGCIAQRCGLIIGASHGLPAALAQNPLQFPA